MKSVFSSLFVSWLTPFFLCATSTHPGYCISTIIWTQGLAASFSFQKDTKNPRRVYIISVTDVIWCMCKGGWEQTFYLLWKFSLVLLQTFHSSWNTQCIALVDCSLTPCHHVYNPTLTGELILTRVLSDQIKAHFGRRKSLCNKSECFHHCIHDTREHPRTDWYSEHKDPEA